MSIVFNAHKIKKSIGPRMLFQGITFGIESGSRIGLVGPNGAGKSTLLKCMAGLDETDDGDMVWTSQVKRSYITQSPVYRDDQSLKDFLVSGLTALEIKDFDSSELTYDLWELISKLNLQETDLEKKFVELSGGGQKKAQIIRALLSKPDFLLMDEPTNHLDVDSIMWVEDYLRNRQDIGYIIVTHDRLFLENTVDEILEINPTFKDGYIRSRGGYAEYIEQRNEYVRAQNVQQQRRQNDLRTELAWLRRGAIARLKKQQARQNSAHELIAEVDNLKTLNRSRKIDIEMKTSGKSPKKLVEINHLNVSRNSKKLITDLNFLIHKNTRLGLLGANGSGKSTLIQLILDSEKLTGGLEYTGEIKKYDDIKVNYFEQNRKSLNPNASVLKNICPDGDYVHVHGKPVHVRGYLDRFGFRHDQHDLKVKEISGGEQNRLLLAILMTQECQLLILDEPTNDLDFQTLDSLKETLDQFDGAIILVSHDRAFLDEVCNEVLYFSQEKNDNELIRFVSFLQWQDWISEKKKAEVIAAKNASKNPKKTARLSYKEEREYGIIEESIAKKESDVDKLKADLSNEDVTSNAKKLLEITTQIGALEIEIEKSYQRWQVLEDKKNS
jgi:ABC transport system ATP-binding/permease protein